MPFSRRAFVAAAGAYAAAWPAARTAFADDPAAANPPASARSVVSHHRTTSAGGAPLTYTATAGTLVLRDDHDAPTANVFSTAYTTGDPARPVTFCYNGGPGSSSLWLHLGAFGPRRIAIPGANVPLRPPYHLADNPSTLLDITDLVFIDPVGTGYSTLAGKGETKDFFGVDEDLRAFSQFIRRWLGANGRSNSPVFLLGESYGTFRSAGLAGRLQADNVSVSGIVLLSTLLDYADDFGGDAAANLPDAFAVPSEAAVAWYHKRVPNPAPDVATAAQRARTFTDDVLLPALLQPRPLTSDERSRLAAQMHELIGLDAAYIERAGLRVTKERFESELLRSEGRVVGRYDGRYVGATLDRNGSEPGFDPSYEAIAPAFTAVFNDYAKTELGWRTDRLYRALPGDVVGAWNFRRDGFEGKVLAPTVIPDLRGAMHANPRLRVFSANGWYDLATPFYATEYELANVGLEPAVSSRISFGYYPSGHMIYLNEDALRSMRIDLGVFYRTTLGGVSMPPGPRFVPTETVTR